uniref:1,3 galactose glycoprotein beta1,6N-acetyl glucosaminyl transferase 1 n=5 Tax=Elephantid herpesvirus 1 TaxID=146015 RepID=A0A866VTI8_ELHV1|nr:1,3 galactose glycoprotein beta1,6N-acetyl glucosaminyl transferase 1 [Elephant endotheliotropic herpesvirus 1A]WES72353.1 1,3 galactose glycoprotein beta1,6N-acetyl glucosaminyl transferase 1 [Elephantid betaherpesvirus 1]
MDRFLNVSTKHMCVMSVVLMILIMMVFVEKYMYLYNLRSLELVGDRPARDVNCTKILHGDSDEILKAKLRGITVDFRRRPRLDARSYINMTRDCDYFIKTRKYLTGSLSREETEFPIAYSIVIHHKIEMFERLLRAIYAPQNLYCVHVDRKADKMFFLAVVGIVSCFDNVFVASKLENVVYASWSRVQADINCMRDLHDLSTKWKYVINLCGTDFPLKTNLEIVKQLKSLDGANSLETERMPPHKMVRWKKRHALVKGVLSNTGQDKDTPPIPIPIFSGSAYFVVTRSYVTHVLRDRLIGEFMEWSKDTYSPDEHLWATLQRMPGVPGAVPLMYKYDTSDMQAIARFVKWQYYEGDVAKGALYPPCNGVHIRSVCVFGSGDVHWILQNAHHLFANKFDEDVDVFAVQCLDEHLRHRSLIYDREPYVHKHLSRFINGYRFDI